VKCNINDDDSSVLSQQASGACNTSQLPPDRLVQSLTGAATQNTICEYHIVYDVPNSPKSTTRIDVLQRNASLQQVATGWANSA